MIFCNNMKNLVNKITCEQILTKENCKDIKKSVKTKFKSNLATIDRELKTVPEIKIVLDGVDSRYYKNNTDLLLGALINMFQVYKKVLKRIE